MSRLLSGLALLAVAIPLSAADLPEGMKYIPADAAVFLHLNVAELYDSKLGDTVKTLKSEEAKERLATITAQTGLTLADVKTFTFAYPKVRDQADTVKGVSVVTFRKQYDRKAVLAALKKDADKLKAEMSEKDNVVRVVAPSPFSPDNKLTTITDLTDLNRIVTGQGLGDDAPRPAEPKGLHADVLTRSAAAVAVAGVNFNALPDELRMENVPAEFRPFKPLAMADAMTAVATLDKGKLTVSVVVTSKDAANAAEVEKSLDAFRLMMDGLIATARKTAETDLAAPKEMRGLYDAAQAALKEVKFAVDGKITTAAVAVPEKTNFAPLLELTLGGGMSSRMVSSNNLKQIGLAMHSYHDTHDHLPAPASLGKKGKKLLSWRVEILPFIEQDALYKKFNHDEPWDSEHNKKVFADNPMPMAFAIAGTTNAADKKTHYQVFAGTGTAFDPAGPVKLTDIQDGTSNTILVVTAKDAVEWTRPDDLEFDPKGEVLDKLLVKDGVIQTLLGDGSVRAMSPTIKDEVFKTYITRSGGEPAKDE